MKDKPKLPKGVHELDLCPITRETDKARTAVYLRTGRFDPWVLWITLGEVSLHKQSSEYVDNRWRLDAYLTEGVTDGEHDSAHALCIPLIGVSFGGIRYQTIEVRALVDPGDDGNDFRVPLPGYDPLEGSVTCTHKACDKPHQMVREGLYMPPRNDDLYRRVAGLEVQIWIGTARPV